MSPLAAFRGGAEKARDPFSRKSGGWGTTTTLKALAAQFGRGGTDELENPQIFQTPEVIAAGGLGALKALGKPAEILLETKARIFRGMRALVDPSPVIYTMT